MAAVLRMALNLGHRKKMPKPCGNVCWKSASVLLNRPRIITLKREDMLQMDGSEMQVGWHDWWHDAQFVCEPLENQHVVHARMLAL